MHHIALRDDNSALFVDSNTMGATGNDTSFNIDLY